MKRNFVPDRRIAFPVKQKGVALAVSLILLVVITLTGLGAIRNAIQQERMSGNSVDRALAMQAAESALQEAHQIIRTNGASIPAAAVNCTVAGANCPADPNAAQNGIPGITWNNVNATGYNVNPPNLPAITPQYSIQFLGWYTQPSPSSVDPNAISTDVVWLYRINARSYDPAVTQNRAFVSLQATAQVQTRL